jgi:hypothetical protein
LERYLEFSSRYSTVKVDLAELECEAAVLDERCRPRRANSRGLRRKGFAVLG